MPTKKQSLESVLARAVRDALIVIDSFHVKLTRSFLVRAYATPDAVRGDTVPVEDAANLCSTGQASTDCFNELRAVFLGAIARLSDRRKEALHHVAEIVRTMSGELQLTEHTLHFLRTIPGLVTGYYGTRLPSEDTLQRKAELDAFLESDHFLRGVPRGVRDLYRRATAAVWTQVSRVVTSGQVQLLFGDVAPVQVDQLKLAALYIYDDVSTVAGSTDSMRSILDLVFKIILSYTSTQHGEVYPGVPARSVTELVTTVRESVKVRGGASMVEGIARDDTSPYVDLLVKTLTIPTTRVTEISERCRTRVAHHACTAVASVEFAPGVDFNTAEYTVSDGDISRSRVVLSATDNLGYSIVPPSFGSPGGPCYLWARFHTGQSIVFQGTIAQVDKRWEVTWEYTVTNHSIAALNVLAHGRTLKGGGRSQMRDRLVAYRSPEGTLLSDLYLADELHGDGRTPFQTTRTKVDRHVDRTRPDKTFTALEASKTFLDVAGNAGNPLVQTILVPILAKTPFKGRADVFLILLHLVGGNLGRHLDKGAVLLTTILRGLLLEVRDRRSAFNLSETYADASACLLRTVLSNLGTFAGKMMQTLNELAGEKWTTLVGPKLRYPSISEGEVQAMLVATVRHGLAPSGTVAEEIRLERVRQAFLDSGIRLRPGMLANASVGQVHVLERLPPSQLADARSLRPRFYQLLGMDTAPTDLAHAKWVTSVESYMNDLGRQCRQPAAVCKRDGFRTIVFWAVSEDGRRVRVRSSVEHHQYELLNYWHTPDPTAGSTDLWDTQAALESKLNTSTTRVAVQGPMFDQREYYCEVEPAGVGTGVHLVSQGGRPALTMRAYTRGATLEGEACMTAVGASVVRFAAAAEAQLGADEGRLLDFANYTASVVSGSLATGRQPPAVASILRAYTRERSRLVVKFIKPRLRMILCFEEELVVGALRTLHAHRSGLEGVLQIVNKRGGGCQVPEKRSHGSNQCRAICQSGGRRCVRSAVGGTEYCPGHAQQLHGLRPGEIDEARQFVDDGGYIVYPYSTPEREQQFRYLAQKSTWFRSGLVFDPERLGAPAPWFRAAGTGAPPSFDLRNLLRTVGRLYTQTSCKLRDIRAEFDLSDEHELSIRAGRTYGHRGFFVPSVYTPHYLTHLLPAPPLTATSFSPVIIQDFVPGNEVEAYNSYPLKGAAYDEVAALASGLTRFGATLVEKLLLTGEGHGDPHPGNMKFLYDHSTQIGTVGILDFGDWIHLDPGRQCVIRGLGKAYIQTFVHLKLREVSLLMHEVFQGAGNESRSSSETPSLATFMAALRTLDFTTLGRLLTVGGGVYTVMEMFVKFVSWFVCLLVKKSYWLVESIVRQVVDVIGKKAVDATLASGGVVSSLAISVATLVAGFAPVVVSSAAMALFGGLFVAMKGLDFSNPKEVHERTKYYTRPFAKFAKKVLSVVSTTLGSVMRALLKPILQVAFPGIVVTETRLQAVIDMIDAYATQTSVAAIMDAHATSILPTGHTPEQALKLSYFLNAHIVDEIDRGACGEMFGNQDLLESFETLTLHTPEEGQCESLATDVAKVGQAILKYSNNFKVLERMDNYERALGMDSVFNQVSELLHICDLTDFGMPPGDAKLEQQCTNCAIKQRRGQWKGQRMLDFVHSELVVPKADT